MLRPVAQASSAFFAPATLSSQMARFLAVTSSCQTLLLASVRSANACSRRAVLIGIPIVPPNCPLHLHTLSKGADPMLAYKICGYPKRRWVFGPYQAIE